MGRFVYNQKTSKNSIQIDEHQLRRPEADSDLSGTDFYHKKPNQNQAYTRSGAGFHPQAAMGNSSGTHTNQSNGGNNKLSYLKAEIDFMVDGFMRELLDFESFSNLSPEIQSEIMSRYPQFFN